ncbi:MAG: DNRLRE domain-containing protein [Planctomycetes bacterium]|nr:DNRLRE domain-containing protein [Planctomycetota bacterium]
MTWSKAFSILGLGIVLTVANHASAATISIGSEKDANMFQNNPTFTADGNEFILTGRNGSNQARRGLIQFDIANSGIPTGATINSATLTLYLRSWSGLGMAAPFGDPRTVALREVTSAWGNGTTVATSGGGGQGIASAAPGDVSWNNRFHSPTTPWGAAGGDFAGSDSASLVITDTTALNAPVAWSGAGVVADVQGWLDNPLSNNGWIVRNSNDQVTTPGTLLEFYSKEVANSALRPVLTIDFTAAEAVPEPATWTLAIMGLGLLGLVGSRYRRRSRAEV